MPVKNTNTEHAAPKRRLRPSIKIAVAVVVAVLLGWMGLRLHHWIAQRGDTRVIVLVNPWNDVDNSGFSPKLKTVEGIQVDKSCVEDLTEMLAACRAAGTPITLTAGYRSPEEQLSLFENEVSRQRAAGRDAEDAEVYRLLSPGGETLTWYAGAPDAGDEYIAGNKQHYRSEAYRVSRESFAEYVSETGVIYKIVNVNHIYRL